ncbi:MAG: TetR/AcrR family transcriptional regulator [Bacteroidales bacterium]|jgi:AcrR family transcriptional regulator|nr:TetR/AcrR family transcriptional regulator [Bacteroidales bacterium]
MVKTKNTDLQTQERIFKAATEVFEEKGFAAARMQEIADRAEINKALLHYYFRSKELLFEAVFQVLLKKMFEKILSVFMMDISFEKKIKLYYEEHINILIKNPNLPLFLLNEISHNPELVQGIRETLRYSEMRDVIYKQHSRELRKYGIKKGELPQLMVTVVSMAIFPFAARNVMKMMMEQLGDNKSFNNFMQARKDFASDFVIAALKNRKK